MRGPRAENASDLQQSRIVLYRPDGPGIVDPVSRRRQTVRSQLCQMSYLDTAQTYEAVGARRSNWYALQSTCAFATSTKFASSIAATVAPMAIRHDTSILRLLHDFHPSENGTTCPLASCHARPKLVLRQRVQPDIDPAITTAVALDIAGDVTRRYPLCRAPGWIMARPFRV